MMILALVSCEPACSSALSGGLSLHMQMEMALEELEAGDAQAAVGFPDNWLTAPVLPGEEVERVLQLATQCLTHKCKQRPEPSVLLEKVKSLQDQDVAEATQLRAKPGVSSDCHFWRSAGKLRLKEQKLFLVDNSTAEYIEVASHFQRTMLDAAIDCIERVENGFMHKSFHLQASTLEKQIAQNWNQRMMWQLLFHCIRAIEDIVNSVDCHGFLPLLSGTSTGVIHGDGTYFARDARYSNDYALTLPSG